MTITVNVDLTFAYAKCTTVHMVMTNSSFFLQFVFINEYAH